MTVTLTKELRQLDEMLFQHLKSFNAESYFIATNRESEKEKFFEARKKKQTYNPQFQYKQPNEHFKKLKAILESIRTFDHPLEKIFHEFVREKYLILNQIEHRDAYLMTKASKELFGVPSTELVQEALAILKKYQPEDDTGVFFGIKLLTDKIRSRLAKDQIEGWGIAESNENVWMAEVDHTAKKIMLQSGTIVNQRMLNHLVRRCIEVSIFRSKNAESQPLRIFELGLSHHQETEQGLTVEIDLRAGAIHPTLIIHEAGKVLASHYAYTHSFAQTFELLTKLFLDEDAYDFTENAKMGLIDTSEEGGWIRGHLGLQGRQKIHSLNKDDLYYLYAGNVSYQHLPLVRQLTNQGLLSKPSFIPEFLV